ncbi:MAG: hypothetical protein JSV15_04875 [Candidatus Bathyarchaeota archaeon]|nr:MAG: hypothetical protein JSV15_04875 [Candidatus Bathyarchaeota archaeon]
MELVKFWQREIAPMKKSGLGLLTFCFWQFQRVLSGHAACLAKDATFAVRKASILHVMALASEIGLESMDDLLFST